jgi:hypothetical protein
MTLREVDQDARLRSLKQGIPESLHVPIAARDLNAISRFVGSPTLLSGKAGAETALLVIIHEPPPRDLSLPIWMKDESRVLYAPHQVWVREDLRHYRRAYAEAFPNLDLSGVVIDHIMNRKLARLKGFKYLRVTPISRSANSSSGRRAEQIGIEYHSTPVMVQYNRTHMTEVEYADLADLVKMLNIKTGGGFLDPVNEGQILVGGPVVFPQGLD